MKRKIEEKLQIPSGINCELMGKEIICKKDSLSLKRKIDIPSIKVYLQNNEIIFSTEKGNKNDFKIINSNIAHIKNMFTGLDKKFVYELEACNVHFPMTLKKEGNYVIINNFLGEKVPRKSLVFPDVDVEIKGQKIKISSSNIEAAGHTAANLERATKISKRDRRIFQDGIFITQKPGALK